MERWLVPAPGGARQSIAKPSHPRSRHHGAQPQQRQRAGSAFVACPLCGRSFHTSQVEAHAAQCSPVPAMATAGTAATAAAADDPGASASDTGGRTGEAAAAAADQPKGDRSERSATIPSIFLSPRARAVALLPSVEHPTLPGQHTIPDFISEAEEAELLEFLDGPDTQPPWKPSTFNGRHFGRRWGVGTKLGCSGSTSVKSGAECFSSPLHEMPPLLVRLVERMRTSVEALRGFRPNEANAIDYQKSLQHFLDPHCDDRRLSGAILVNLCLAGDARMTYTEDFRGREAAAVPEPQSVAVLLPRRSLQVQAGRVRYNFRHGIATDDFLGDRRVSITFRQNRFDGFNV